MRHAPSVRIGISFVSGHGYEESTGFGTSCNGCGDLTFMGFHEVNGFDGIKDISSCAINVDGYIGGCFIVVKPIR